MRIAETTDLPKILEMSELFAKTTPQYTKYADSTAIETLATKLIADQAILLSDTGMAWLIASPFIFGTDLMATVIAWYVDPKHRGKGEGKQLLKDCEQWAQNRGCRAIVFSVLDNNKTMGDYTLMELAYMKEL